MPRRLDVINLFRTAARTVPAYRAFLKKHHIQSKQIRTENDFAALPITNKKNYITSSSLAALFPNSNIPAFGYASSGSSGQSTFWFRADTQEKLGAIVHEQIVRDIFKIKKTDSTLIVICFSMGVWVAGGFTLAAFREVARRGYKLTVMTPGLEMKDTIAILARVALEFKNVILVGYPPFLMDVLHAAHNQKIKLPNRLFALTSGDKFSEQWRDDFSTLAHIKLPQQIISLYGSADGGPLAYETPLTIYVRRKAQTNHKLAKALFDNEPTEPALFQYNQECIFFETSGSELLITAPTASPLIRYNIHDEGYIIQFSMLKKILTAQGLLTEARRRGLLRWQSPLIIKKGRSDVAVMFYALNIYPEHIRAGLEDPQIRKLVSGQYFAYATHTRHSKHQHLRFNIELAPGIKPRASLRSKIQDSLVTQLLKLNIEYRKLSASIGTRALPYVRLFMAGKRNFKIADVRGILNSKGKKPRVSQ